MFCLLSRLQQITESRENNPEKCSVFVLPGKWKTHCENLVELCSLPHIFTRMVSVTESYPIVQCHGLTGSLLKLEKRLKFDK